MRFAGSHWLYDSPNHHRMWHTHRAAGAGPVNTCDPLPPTPCPPPKDTQQHTLPSRAAPDGISQHWGWCVPLPFRPYGYCNKRMV
jgi:hypothetical protein